VALNHPSWIKLAPLALKMIEKTVEWIHTVHKHLDYEYTRLTQQFIQDEDALILLSEEVIIMHNRIHAVRRQRMEFVASKDNKADYMARCIWITCQVHRVMQEFVEGGLRNNPAISTAFIRFLTKMMGGNVSVGVGGQIKALTDSIVTLTGAVTRQPRQPRKPLRWQKKPIRGQHRQIQTPTRPRTPSTHSTPKILP
jgi:hypothetical protein